MPISAGRPGNRQYDAARFNEAGAQGWEMVSGFADGGGAAAESWACFKRPLP